MSEPTEHRAAPPPPQPSTVVSEAATADAAAQDYAQSSGLPAGHFTATPHTLGRK